MAGILAVAVAASLRATRGLDRQAPVAEGAPPPFPVIPESEPMPAELRVARGAGPGAESPGLEPDPHATTGAPR